MKHKAVSIIAIVLIAITIFFILTGCSASSSSANTGQVKEEPFFIEVNHKLSDGRTVLCLYRQERIGGYSSGMTMTTDCDWANAKVIK